MNKSPSMLHVGASRARALDAVRSPYRDMVSQSWRRCLDEYRLNPSQPEGPQWVGQSELLSRMQQLAEVIDCARHDMDALFQQLGEEQCAVILTDADGVIVHMVSSPSFAQEGHALGLRAGGAWSERVAGTNGMGTCLASHSPILIHREEHFFQRLSRFTCSAVPVLDPQGTVVAVLDVTSSSGLMQPSLLGLLDHTARLIEGRLIDARYRDAYPVRFHTRTEEVFTHGEGRLAVSGQGRILAANRSALRQLGFRSVHELSQHHLEDLFQTTLEDMLERSLDASFHPVMTRGQGDARFYAVAQRPASELRARRHAQPARAAENAPPHVLPPQAALASRAVDDGYACFKDARMAAQLSTACRVIAHQTPLLLCGETGTGKEVFARTVHQRSPYAQGPFVAINCASLPATLIEAELFGYRTGAFTGAKRGGRPGKILQAHHGTLFLDEIADMPLDLQARLLRVLDERQVSPLGTDESFPVDFQLISASHQHLPALVRQQRFREDLYYRLLGIELHMVPLRERQDRRELIHHLLQSEGGEQARLSAAAEQDLMRHPWPGNLRELRHALRTASALADGDWITPEHLQCLVGRGLHDIAQGPWLQAGLPGAFDAAHPMGALDCAQAEPGSDPVDRLNLLQRNERQALLQMIEEQHWTMSRVAKRLGISRNTLYRKLHKLQIPLDGERRG